MERRKYINTARMFAIEVIKSRCCIFINIIFAMLEYFEPARTLPYMKHKTLFYALS